MYTDNKLKQKILAFDSEAIGYLHQRYRNIVCSAAISILKLRELAEEFAQAMRDHLSGVAQRLEE